MLYPWQAALINSVNGVSVNDCLEKISHLNNEQKSLLLYLYHNNPDYNFGDNLLVALSQWEYDNAQENT